MNITTRKLTISDKEQLYNLIEEIETTLSNKDFWLPINKISKDHFFDEKWTIFYGAFDGNKLIGASALFLNPHEYEESFNQLKLDINLDSVAEIGRSMVRPDYRGNYILARLNKILLHEALAHNKKYILATIHPDNTPSQKSFALIGMKKMTQYTKACGYVRDILFGEVSQLLNTI